MKKYLLLLGVLVSQIANAQTTNTTKSTRDISIVYEQEQANIKAIQAILDNQITAWNKGDIDAPAMFEYTRVVCNNFTRGVNYWWLVSRN